MNTAYNRRIASEVDAINHRAARHAPANFVGKGYGSDCGIDTQYRDVMGSAYNHPRDLSRIERENRAENELKYGSGFMDDLGQAFRYTPLGMASDAISGRDTVFSGRGYSGISGGNYLGGNSYAKVGVTMPFREVPEAGVVDFADPLNGEGMAVSGGLRYPRNTKVQVGNSDGSGEPPKVGCAWYNTWDDFKGGRNRMMDSKKIGRMTKMPEMPTDLNDEEMSFVEGLFDDNPSGAGYYGGAWYNDWDDFTAAIKEGYDAVVGVWEDYIKPVLDVIGTPVKDALISSGNPYGEAGGAFLELLGYGRGGNMALGAGDGIGGFNSVGAAGSDGNGRTGMSGGYAVSGAGRGGTVGRSGGAVGVFANAKPINANSLGFDPKLEVEQLNAATGSTSYGDMPTSNPVGSGMAVSGGKKRRLVKNVSGVFAAPTKMGEGYVDDDGYYVTTPRDLERHKREKYTSLDGNADADTVKNRLIQAGKDVLEAARRNAPEIAEYGRDKLLEYIGVHLPAEFRGKAEAISILATQPFINEWKEKIKKEVNKDKPRLGRGVLKITHGGAKKKEKAYYDTETPVGIRPDPVAEQRKYEREMAEKEWAKYEKGYSGGNKMERAGLAVSGDNSMGAIVAERGFSKKSQKEAAAVEDKASDNMWEGEKMENVAGRSGKKINNLILQSATRGQKGVSQGGAGYGGAEPLTQTNNLKAVFGGGGEKSGMKRKGQANAYSQLTKKIMAEKGMRLGEASAYIKANGLYKKA